MVTIFALITNLGQCYQPQGSLTHMQRNRHEASDGTNSVYCKLMPRVEGDSMRDARLLPELWPGNLFQRAKAGKE